MPMTRRIGPRGMRQAHYQGPGSRGLSSRNLLGERRADLDDHPRLTEGRSCALASQRGFEGGRNLTPTTKGWNADRCATHVKGHSETYVAEHGARVPR